MVWMIWGVSSMGCCEIQPDDERTALQRTFRFERKSKPPRPALQRSINRRPTRPPHRLLMTPLRGTQPAAEAFGISARCSRRHQQPPRGLGVRAVGRMWSERDHFVMSRFQSYDECAASFGTSFSRILGHLPMVRRPVQDAREYSLEKRH